MKALDAIGRFFSALVRTFKPGGPADAALTMACNLVQPALPIIDMVAGIAAGATPTLVDDTALAFVHAKFPRLTDGSLSSGQELKDYLFTASWKTLQQKYPTISESVARLAVQAAYTAQHAEQKTPPALPTAA